MEEAAALFVVSPVLLCLEVRCGPTMEVRSRAQQLVERALELAQVQGGECCAQKQELVSCLRGA